MQKNKIRQKNKTREFEDFKKFRKFKNLSTYAESDLKVKGTALTIGNFDGCHLGHQKLLEKTTSLAKKLSCHSAVLTFDPHPTKFFLGSKNVDPHMFTDEQKDRCFGILGVENHIQQTFDQEFSNLTGDQFFDLIVDSTDLKALVVGYDFKFGKDRKGTTDWLAKKCQLLGIEFFQLEPEQYESTPISSTRIRNALKEEGDVRLAKTLLGRPYFIEGKVTTGKKLGTKLGFPTANLQLPDCLLPKNGVYAVQVALEKSGPIPQAENTLLRGIANLGLRPTLDTKSVTRVLEVHLFDFEDSLYDKQIGVFFIERLRDEKKFPSLTELTDQIQKDVYLAKKTLDRK